MLLATCMCWFLLDVAYVQLCLFLFDILLVHDSFYGINLNQNVVLQQIGYDGKVGTPWHRLFKISTGGMIVTALGFVPGKKISRFNFIPEAKYLIRNDSF
jgi:PHS family inorganic phosphate transporter-like MFS transporter